MINSPKGNSVHCHETTWGLHSKQINKNKKKKINLKSQKLIAAGIGKINYQEVKLKWSLESKRF